MQRAIVGNNLLSLISIASCCMFDVRDYVVCSRYIKRGGLFDLRL